MLFALFVKSDYEKISHFAAILFTRLKMQHNGGDYVGQR